MIRPDAFSYLADLIESGLSLEEALRIVKTTVADYNLELAKGNIGGHAAVNKFGINEALGTTIETIWGNGGSIYTHPASASTMTISSSSANDTSAGTGARTVEIYGLDANYLEISEVLTLNGQSGVTSVNSYLRANRMIVRSVGSEENNAGSIYFGTGTITAGVPANAYAIIPIIDGVGSNQSMMAIYTVPANKTYYIDHVTATAGKGKDVAFNLMVRPLNEAFQTKLHVLSYQSPFHHPRDVYIKCNEKSDIEVRAVSDGVSTHVSSEFEGILVDN